MAKICGVLHVTLLLYLFWLPSAFGVADLVGPDGPRGFQPAGPDGPRHFQPVGPDGPRRFKPVGPDDPGRFPPDEYGVIGTSIDEEEKLKEGYSPGNMYIINLLKSYVYSGCKAGTAGDLVGAMQRPSFSPGERYIIKLLSSYFSSGCEEGAGRTWFSPGEKHITEVLSSYFSSDCTDGEGVEDNAVKGLNGVNYTTGEFHILNRLSCSFSSGCRVNADKSSEDGAGRNVQFVVLEMFLLIFGACLTWIEM